MHDALSIARLKHTRDNGGDGDDASPRTPNSKTDEPTGIGRDVVFMHALDVVEKRPGRDDEIHRTEMG